MPSFSSGWSISSIWTNDNTNMNQGDESSQETVIRLQERNDSLERELSSKKRENTDLRRQQENHQATISFLYGQLDDKEKQIKSLQSTLNNREQQDIRRLNDSVAVTAKKVSLVLNSSQVHKKDDLNMIMSSVPGQPGKQQKPECQQQSEQVKELQGKLSRSEEEKEKLRQKYGKKKEDVARLTEERDSDRRKGVDERHKMEIEVVQLKLNIEHLEKGAKPGLNANSDGSVVINDMPTGGVCTRLESKKSVEINYAGAKPHMSRSSSAPVSTNYTLSRYLQENPQGAHSNIDDNFSSVSQANIRQHQNCGTQTDLYPPTSPTRHQRFPTVAEGEGETGGNQQSASVQTQTVQDLDQPVHTTSTTTAVDDFDLDGDDLDDSFHSSPNSLGSNS